MVNGLYFFRTLSLKSCKALFTYSKCANLLSSVYFLPLLIVIRLYVLFLTDRVSQDRMAHLDPEEFQAVTELKYETLQTTSLHQFTDRLNGLKLKKRANKYKQTFFFLYRVKEDSQEVQAFQV